MSPPKPPPDFVDQLDAAYPGDDDFHRAAKKAIRNLYLDGRAVDADLTALADCVEHALQSPPFAIWSGDLSQRAALLAADLTSLAARIKSSAATLAGMQKHWEKFVPPSERAEGSDDAVRDQSSRPEGAPASMDPSRTGSGRPT